MKYNEYIDFEEWNTDQPIDKGIMVTVWCVTYNHVKYIKDALEGFVNQRTNFSYEVVIYDDASTDGTSDIVRDYSLKYPNIIKAHIAKENTYGKSIRREIIDSIKQTFQGRYVAICEGDDCWIDRNKLQIQVDYMEEHPECALTLHNAIRINYLNGNIEVFNDFSTDRELNIDDILYYKGRMETASMVYRSEYEIMPDVFRGYSNGDWQMQLYLKSQGKVYYFDRIMSIYRNCTEGSWTRNRMNNKLFDVQHSIAMIYFLEDYNEYTGGKYKTNIAEVIQNKAKRIALGLGNDGKYDVKPYFDSITESKLQPIKNELQELQIIMMKGTHCTKNFLKNIESYEHILIWGTGDGGQIIASHMYIDDIEWDGFIVFDTSNHKKTFMNKKVWRLEDYPFSMEDTIIIVGIYSLPYIELLEELGKNGIQHYTFPFLFNCRCLPRLC